MSTELLQEQQELQAQQLVQLASKAEVALSGLQTQKLSEEGVALLAELRATNAELKKTLSNPAWQKMPDDAAAALAKVRSLVEDPTLPRTLQSMARSLGRIGTDPSEGQKPRPPRPSTDRRPALSAACVPYRFHPQAP